MSIAKVVCLNFGNDDIFYVQHFDPNFTIMVARATLREDRESYSQVRPPDALSTGEHQELIGQEVSLEEIMERGTVFVESFLESVLATQGYVKARALTEHSRAMRYTLNGDDFDGGVCPSISENDLLLIRTLTSLVAEIVKRLWDS